MIFVYRSLIVFCLAFTGVASGAIFQDIQILEVRTIGTDGLSSFCVSDANPTPEISFVTNARHQKTYNCKVRITLRGMLAASSKANISREASRETDFLFVRYPLVRELLQTQAQYRRQATEQGQRALPIPRYIYGLLDGVSQEKEEAQIARESDVAPSEEEMNRAAEVACLSAFFESKDLSCGPKEQEAIMRKINDRIETIHRN